MRSPVSSRGTLVISAAQKLKGTVVSTAMNKSVVVATERLQPHETYMKRVRVTKRYTADDAEGKAKIGDYVLLEGCRPLSKTKRYTVAEIIRAAQ